MANVIKGQVIPVKLRPDQYCSKIKDMGRGMKAKVTRLKDMVEYIKIEKDRKYDMRQEKIYLKQVMFEPLNNVMLENTLSGHKGVIQSHSFISGDANNNERNDFIHPSREKELESCQVAKLKEDTEESRPEEGEISEEEQIDDVNIENADYCCSTKGRIIRVKIRPDEYCSKIREIQRKGKKAQVMRVEDTIEYIKTVKDKNHNSKLINLELGSTLSPPYQIHPELSSITSGFNIMAGTEGNECMEPSREQEVENGEVEVQDDVIHKCSEENENYAAEQNNLGDSSVFIQLSEEQETGGCQVHENITENNYNSHEGSEERKQIEDKCGENVDYSFGLKVHIIPVKIRPDEYCGKIREMARKGRTAPVIRIEEAIKYIKIGQVKSFDPQETTESSKIVISQDKEILASEESSTVTLPNELNGWAVRDVFLPQTEKGDLEVSEIDVEEDMTFDNNREFETTSSVSLNKRLIDNFRGGSEAHICIHCNLTFATRNLLERHLKKHSEYRPFKCPICERGFKTQRSVQNHVNTHTASKPYKCEFCEASFSSSGQQIRHIRYIHTYEKPHKCKICDYSSVESSKLKRHMRNHTGERPYPCPNCTYASPDTFSLKRHLRTHSGEKPYICDVCGDKFSQSNSLKVHKTIHSDDRPAYECELCQATLTTKAGLRHHVQEFHYSKQHTLCKKCGKSFPDKYTLRVHEKIHKGEKCFKCGRCSFSSDSQAQLRSHMVIHCDEKLFQCDKCDQSFRWKHALKRHQNLQHNPFYVLSSLKKKSYQCPECDECFIRKGSLHKHVALHDLQNTASVEKIETQTIIQDTNDQRPEVVDSNTLEEHNPDKEASYEETIHHVLLDVLPLPDDGDHGGVQIAAWSADNEQEMVPSSQDIVQIMKSADLQQQEEVVRIRKELDRANCFGFCEDEDSD